MAVRGPLIGRERELLLLEHALDSACLLTLTGPGGCGKTRVALELAGRVALARPELPATVVELATVGSADELVSALMQALGVRERGGRPAEDVLVEELGS